MVKTKYFLLLPLIASIVLLGSCDNDNPEPNDRSYFLSGNTEFGKTWSISEIEIEIGTVQPHQCVTDNFITYFPNGNYEINEGASKCDPNDPPAVTGSWTLNSFETKIFVEFGDSVQTWNIESINSEVQRISSEFQEGERIYSLRSVNSN